MGCFSSKTHKDEIEKRRPVLTPILVKPTASKSTVNEHIIDKNSTITPIDKIIQPKLVYNQKVNTINESIKKVNHNETFNETFNISVYNSNNKYHFIMKASKFEAIYPFWADIGTKIKFNVTGTWAADSKYPLTDHKGYISVNNNYKYNNGSLLFRTLGSEYTQIENNIDFDITHSGPLFLKMFISDINMNPKGSLTVSVTGVNQLTFKEINKRIGWNGDSDNDQIPKHCYSKPESKIIELLGKLKSNPKLFAIQYLESIKQISKHIEKIYNKLLHITPSKFNNDDKLYNYVKHQVKNDLNIDESCSVFKVFNESIAALPILILFLLNKDIFAVIFNDSIKDYSIYVDTEKFPHCCYLICRNEVGVPTPINTNNYMF